MTTEKTTGKPDNENLVALRDTWRARIEAIPRDWVNMKELAGAIETSYGKVSNDLARGKIAQYERMGPEGTRAEVRIPKWAALQYIDGFQVARATGQPEWPRLPFSD